MRNATDIAALQARHGLSYHIPFCEQADSLVGLRGKKVLEVGGSLPASLVLDTYGAEQWVAVEEADYWTETLSTGHVQGTPPAQGGPRHRLAEASAATLQPHQVLFGRIEDLPASLHGHFDLVFSIAAFEHIAQLPEALERMRDALRPGGRLFTLFSPLWSSAFGHHLPEIEDAKGQRYNFTHSPIPPWGHLTMRPMELFDHLLASGCDAATARRIVYFVHQSPHISRHFLDDYREIVQRCSLCPLLIHPVFEQPVPPHLLAQLQARWPGRQDFAHAGLLLVLERAATLS